MVSLIDRLDRGLLRHDDVLDWGIPVAVFGDLHASRIASLGINPSNREFVDQLGIELREPTRRFPTLRSLGIESWSEVDSRHLNLILDSYRAYFRSNPYDGWFRRLDAVIAGTGASYYCAFDSACHLDLVPFATEHKWSNLTSEQQSSLLRASGDTLALLLRDSPVRVLVLNGSSVVREFQRVARVCLDAEPMPEWSLPRTGSRDVPGVAFSGVVDSISGIELNHDLLILGFNHNLQSSFGVTKAAVAAIRDWVAQSTREFTE
ncbi:MAG: hypothetical protein HOL45_12145 [Chloroflexi bacterium]|nr:hypothetical protein [Chloroflexota bacterium]